MKSQGFLATNSVTVAETVDARKNKFEGHNAVAFVRQVEEVWIAKGKNVRQIVFQKEAISDDELLKLVTGPTGNLRAPTLRRGKKLFVGFHPEELAKFLV